MDVWHFTEMPYPHLPPLEEMSSMWVTLPNRVFDPKIGADLYKRYFDEYVIADELGFNLMVNEHHQTATCIECGRAALRSHPCAADQERPHLRTREPGRQSRRSG